VLQLCSTARLRKEHNSRARVVVTIFTSEEEEDEEVS